MDANQMMEAFQALLRQTDKGRDKIITKTRTRRSRKTRDEERRQEAEETKEERRQEREERELQT